MRWRMMIWFCRPSLRIRPPDLCWLTCYRILTPCPVHPPLLTAPLVALASLLLSQLLFWSDDLGRCVGGGWCEIVAPVLGPALIAGLCWLTLLNLTLCIWHRLSVGARFYSFDFSSVSVCLGTLFSVSSLILCLQSSPVPSRPAHNNSKFVNDSTVNRLKYIWCTITWMAAAEVCPLGYLHLLDYTKFKNLFKNFTNQISINFICKFWNP